MEKWDNENGKENKKKWENKGKWKWMWTWKGKRENGKGNMKVMRQMGKMTKYKMREWIEVKGKERREHVT